MPKYNTPEENLAEYGADYDKIKVMKPEEDLTDVSSIAGRKRINGLVGNIIDMSDSTPNRSHCGDSDSKY
jgi:hypothetical protein